MFKIVAHTKQWFIIAGTLTVISVAALFFFGLRVGIDYKGGTAMEIKSADSERSQKIEEALKELEYNNVQLKPSGESKVTLRLPALSDEDHGNLLATIKNKLPDAEETQYDTVGPTVGKDLTNRSIVAVVLASLAIIIYVAYAFRRLPKPLSSWIFGLSAVIALIHDLLITSGIVSILGNFFHWMEVDVLFITALLTIMGFSVHDTIVVYDRLRENFIKNPHRAINVSAEESINQTIVRSINTSLTVMLVLLALLLLGSSSIRHFVLTLTIGVFIGTYSSIFIATPLVVYWHNNSRKKLK